MIEYLCLGCVLEFQIYFSESTKITTIKFPQPEHPIVETETSGASIIQIKIQFFILLAIPFGV